MDTTRAIASDLVILSEIARKARAVHARREVVARESSVGNGYLTQQVELLARESAALDALVASANQCGLFRRFDADVYLMVLDGQVPTAAISERFALPVA